MKLYKNLHELKIKQFMIKKILNKASWLNISIIGNLNWQFPDSPDTHALTRKHPLIK